MKVVGGWPVTSDASPWRCCGFRVVTLFGVRGLWEQLAGPNTMKSEETSSLRQTCRMSRTQELWSRGIPMYLWPGAERAWLIQGILGSFLWELSASLFLHPDLPVCIYSKLPSSYTQIHNIIGIS